MAFVILRFTLNELNRQLDYVGLLIYHVLLWTKLLYGVIVLWRHVLHQILHNVCAGSSGVGLEYQLSDPDDRSFYFGVNKQRDTVVNPCLNSTYRFVELIIQHLISLHKVTSYC